MLDTFTPEQKATILSSIMREESNGHTLRDCCRAQGITLQTFLSWRKQAQHSNRFDTLIANGPRLPRHREPPPPTAMELALKRAQEAVLPAPEVDQPPAPAACAQTVHDLFTPPEIADIVADATTEKTESQTTMPKPIISPPRGRVTSVYANHPWLAELDVQTARELGPRPAKKTNPTGYMHWLKHRQSLMTPEQSEIYRAAFAGNGTHKTKPAKAPKLRVAKRQPSPKSRAEQLEMAAARADAPINGLIREAIETLPGGPAAAQTPAANVSELVARHAEVSSAIANHPETGLAPVSVNAPRNRDALAFENERLKRALTALTIENLQLRGLL